MRAAQPWRTSRARGLRSRQTSAEDRMWWALRGRRFFGLKLVRQLPIGPFFADLVCRERGIVVEIDGATHSTPEEQARDRARAAFIARQGFRIFRTTNTDVYDNIDGVLDSLREFIDDGT